MQKLINYIFLFSLLTMAGVFGEALYAQKSEQGIRQMLNERDREIKALLGPEGTGYTQQQREKLKDIINEVIDYTAMAKYALQDTWATLSVEEREEFVDLFSDIVREHSLTNLDIYRASVTYEKIEITGDDAVVVTMATLDRVRTPVTYMLHFEVDTRQWVVTDLIIDNVSTARSYKRQFQDIIRSNGYDSLIAMLRDRANK